MSDTTATAVQGTIPNRRAPSNGSTMRKGLASLRPMTAEDLFAHFSSIQMNGFKTLKEGQKVAF